MKKIGNILLTIVFIFGLNSCYNSDENNFIVNADAYIIKRIVENEPVYTIAYYAYGNKAITSGSVTKPDGGTVVLGSVDTDPFTMFKEPAKNEFTSNTPIIGNYQFDVVSVNDEFAQLFDELEMENLGSPKITKTEYNAESKTLEITWDPVSGADGYVVKLAKQNGDVIHLGYSLDWDAIKYQISSSFGNWTSITAFGTTYFVEVHAFVYETDATEENSVYNLQEISIGEKEIIWGQ